MACDDFVTKSPWTIMQTEKRVVEPFVPGNVVQISLPRLAGHLVQVFHGSQSVGTYPDFTCLDTQLDGKVGNDELLLTIVVLSGGATITGQWNPTQQTTGTWTGDEGGGGGGSDEA